MRKLHVYFGAHAVSHDVRSFRSRLHSPWHHLWHSSLPGVSCLSACSEEGDEDEEDEDEDDEDASPAKPKGKGKKGGAPGEQPPECKQQ